MRSMVRGQLHRRALQLGLLSVAAIFLSACSSDADRLSLFGVDRGQPDYPRGQYAQPVYSQPQVATQQVAQLPVAAAPASAPRTVTPAAAGLPTPAPYTAPTYVAPGYPQTTASVSAPAQLPAYRAPQPLPQSLPQPIAQSAPGATPSAQLARLPSGYVGGQTQPQLQPVVRRPAVQPVYQQPQPLPQPAPLTTASIPSTPQALPTVQAQPQALPQPLPAQPALTAQLPTQINRDAGWSAIGGTRVQVQPGETLFSMSRRYGIPVQVLQQTNNISDANAVRAGQQIIIPVYSTASVGPSTAPASLGVDTTLTGAVSSPAVAQTPSAAQQATRVPAPTPRPGSLTATTQPQLPQPQLPQTQAQPAAVSTASTGGVHVVEQGDTVYSIARRYGMQVQQLTAANGITDPNAIRIGQRLTVGASTATAPATASAPAATQTPAQVVATRAYTPPTPAAESAAVVEQTAAVREVAARNDAIAEQTPLQFRWPIRGRVLSEFGTLPTGVRNDGINIAVPEGASIRAAEDGEVVYAGNELRGFGNLVLIQHRGGYVTAYAHNSSISVERGDRVSRGEIIARAGSTGDVDTPQLHFEIRRGTTPVDPSPYLPQS